MGREFLFEDPVDLSIFVLRAFQRSQVRFLLLVMMFSAKADLPKQCSQLFLISIRFGCVDNFWRRSHLLAKRLELFATEIAIAKYFQQQPGTDSFTRVDGNHRRSAVGVAKKMMTASDSDYLETCLGQNRYKFFAGKAR
jgi:hypothetical protein